MNKNEESWHPMHFLVASIVLASIFLLLLKPECALEGASRGLSL